MPHPFDRYRSSGLKGDREVALAALAQKLDWVEAYNARVVFGDAQRARRRSSPCATACPAWPSRDAHSLLEVGVAYTIVPGPIETPDQLLAALAQATLMPGHASYLVRGLTPLAKLINRTRGNGRLGPLSPRR